jgi:hypothetical protein
MASPIWVTAPGLLTGSPFIADVTTSIQLSATPSTVDNIVMYSVLNASLPSGLSLNTVSGLITGSPTTPAVPYVYTSTRSTSANPIVGSQWFDSPNIMVYNGTAWVNASTAVTATVPPKTKADGTPLTAGD